MKLTFLWFSVFVAADCLLGSTVIAGNHIRQRQAQDGTASVVDDKLLDDQLRQFHEDNLSKTLSNRQGRQLQRVAEFCTENPTPFSTSLFVTHIGDGTSFQAADLDALLEKALLTFNSLDADQCDSTFRTLRRVSVGDVFYTDSLDYIRLRYDVEGSCLGCLVPEGQMSTGIGPLFGGAEQMRRYRHRDLASNRQGRGIKGGRKRGRELQKNQNKSGKRQDAPCACNNDDLADADQRGPTASEFAAALNTVIQQARADNTLSGVTNVEDIFEAGVVGTSTVVASNDVGEASSCAAANNQDFATTVWIEVTGSPLTEAEILPVEVALMETFNEMNLAMCDTPFFRKVSDVTYEGSQPGQNGQIQMRFEVSGKCLNCDPETILLFELTADDTGVVNVEPTMEFQPPAPSRLLAEIERLEQAQSGPVVVTTTCVCPLNEQDLPLRSPTEKEFANVLQATIETLRAEGLVTSIQQIVVVTEGEIQGVCPDTATQWVSTVFADFDGKPSLLSSSEIATLEGGFVENYQELGFEGCDEYFRTIQEVTLIPGISRRRSLQGTSTGSAVNSTDVVDLQSELPSVYMVAGQCRGCPVSESGTFNMFDQGFRFRHLMEGDTKERHAYSHLPATMNGADFMSFMSGSSTRNKQRRMQDCACAAGAVPDAPYAPKAADFTDSYNVKIMAYKEQGLVTNINGVLSMQEVAPYLVVVGFSIFYGSLERLGSPSDSDYDQLAGQTAAFYRNRLQGVYGNDAAASLKSVQVSWLDGTARADLDRLRVDFEAELIFEESGTTPTSEAITEVMENFNYVEYIKDYVWEMGPNPNEDANAPSPNAFRGSHTVLFTGTESVVVDVRMAVTVRSDRTNQQPNSADRRGLAEQINRFFLGELTKAGLLVVSFSAIIDAGDIEFNNNGVLMTDFNVKIHFSKELDTPTQEAVMNIIQSADLSVLTQYLLEADPVGSTIFSDTLQIEFTM